MANPQKEKGHTGIANEILENLYNQPLSGSEFRIILLVLRKTWGWQKKEDKISLSQIVTDTKLSRKQVCEVINKLVTKRLLFKNKKHINSYVFNKKYNEWLVTEKKLGGYSYRKVNKELPNGKQIVTDTKPKVVTDTKHTKEKKETIQKKLIQKKLVEKENMEKFNNEDIRLTNLLLEKVRENFPFIKSSPSDKDFAEMNRLNRLDDKPYEIIELVIHWSTQDIFWKQNIRSVTKLRKHFDTLLIKAGTAIQERSIKSYD